MFYSQLDVEFFLYMITDIPYNVLLSITRNSSETVALLPRTNNIVKLNSINCIVVT